MIRGRFPIRRDFFYYNSINSNCFLDTRLADPAYPSYLPPFESSMT
jgi:hypothetical protein